MTALTAEPMAPLVSPDPPPRVWSPARPATSSGVALAPPPPEPPPLAAPPTPASPPAERSGGLVALFTARGPRADAQRAAVGLLAAVPFAFVSSLGIPTSLAQQVIASVTLPLALALVAAVGLTASAIGISLLSHPLAPRDAVDVGTRAILRMGMVLAGLTPMVGLWVASYEGIAVLFVPSLTWAIAGISGLSTMNAGLLSAVHPRGSVSPGSVAVLVLLTLFTVAVGIRLWAAFVTNVDFGGGA